MADLYYPATVFENEIPAVVFIPKVLEFNQKTAKGYSSGNHDLGKPLGDTITLPMPNGGLQEGLNHNWSSESSIIGDMTQQLAKMADDKFTKGLSQKMASQSTGRILDPKLTQLYQGSQPRSWECTFTFMPESSEEAKNIIKIINSFKKWGSPKKGDGIKTKYITAGETLIQPNIFKIVFTNPLIQRQTQFNSMALNSINLDYFPDGYPSTFLDGMPKKINLSMSFAEYGLKIESDWY